jgi:hypothetical protein
MMNSSFGPLKQVGAGLLNVGYAEAGPRDWGGRTACAEVERSVPATGGPAPKA